jgi:hypothetical protein
MKGMDEGLTAGEWEQFITLLQRFAEHDLDQHDAWQVDTSFGPYSSGSAGSRGRMSPLRRSGT